MTLLCIACVEWDKGHLNVQTVGHMGGQRCSDTSIFVQVIGGRRGTSLRRVYFRSRWVALNHLSARITSLLMWTAHCCLMAEDRTSHHHIVMFSSIEKQFLYFHSDEHRPLIHSTSGSLWLDVLRPNFNSSRQTSNYDDGIFLVYLSDCGEGKTGFDLILSQDFV